MRIRFIQAVAGGSWAYRPGEVHDVPDEIARQYIAHSVAVPVEDEPELETAMLGPEPAAVLLRPARHRMRGRDD